MKRTVRAAAILASFYLATPAFAQMANDPDTMWEQFAKGCNAVVVADDPLLQASISFGRPSASGMSADKAIASGSLFFDQMPPDVQAMFVMTTVQRYPNGRTVQCMLQLIQPEGDWARLVGIARTRAMESFPAVSVAAGGPFKPIQVPEGAPPPPDVKDMTFLRFASEEFPPRATLFIQVMPRVITLIYLVHQPGDD